MFWSISLIYGGSHGLKSTQHYVTTFVSDLRLVGGFNQVLRFLPQWFFDWLIDWLIVYRPMSYISATFMKRKFQQRIIPVNNHNLILSSFMTYYQVCTKSMTTGASSGTGTDYLPVHMRLTPILYWGLLCSICPYGCLLFSIVLSVFRQEAHFYNLHSANIIARTVNARR